MNSEISTEMVMLLAGILLVLGVIGVIIRKNILFILMSVEIMMNAAGLAFIAAGSRWGQADGQVMFIFILAVAAAEVAIGLAMILQIYHQHKSLDIDKLKEMNG
jgi:NADH-quinone oxidoreductase subunit K